MGSRVSYHSPTMAEHSTPAPRKGGRTATCGAAPPPITSKTRNTPSVQTTPVSLPRGKQSSEKKTFLLFPLTRLPAVHLEAAEEVVLLFHLNPRDVKLT